MSDYLKSRQQHIFDGRPLPQKKQYKIPKVSEKRAKKEAKEKAERGGDDTELQKWYKGRVKLMTGYCTETGESKVVYQKSTPESFIGTKRNFDE